jgi:hypothetical protein
LKNHIKAPNWGKTSEPVKTGEKQGRKLKQDLGKNQQMGETRERKGKNFILDGADAVHSTFFFTSIPASTVWVLYVRLC